MPPNKERRAMCDCIKKLNERISAEYGKGAGLVSNDCTHDGRIALTGVFRPTTAGGAQYKHNRYLGIYPAYCPFCGKPYDATKLETQIRNPY